MNDQIDTSRQDKNSHRLSIKQTCTYGMFTEDLEWQCYFDKIYWSQVKISLCIPTTWFQYGTLLI